MASERHQPVNQFLLQVRKQQEDSAILLASNRPQHNNKTKNRSTEMEKQNFKGKDIREKTKNTNFLKAGSNNQKVGAMRL
jgi:hypothetical protein